MQCLCVYFKSLCVLIARVTNQQSVKLLHCHLCLQCYDNSSQHPLYVVLAVRYMTLSAGVWFTTVKPRLAQRDLRDLPCQPRRQQHQERTQQRRQDQEEGEADMSGAEADVLQPTICT